MQAMANALAIWQRPRKPDHALVALFSLSGMFPPGWKKSWGVVFDPKTGKEIRIWPAIRGSVRDTIAMRELDESVLRGDAGVVDQLDYPALGCAINLILDPVSRNVDRERHGQGAGAVQRR